MSLQITPKDMLRTFMLFPLYITFFVILLLVIIFASFLPNGKILGTKLYNIFGLSGLIAAGIDLKVTGDVSKYIKSRRMIRYNNIALR